MISLERSHTWVHGRVIVTDPPVALLPESNLLHGYAREILSTPVSMMLYIIYYINRALFDTISISHARRFENSHPIALSIVKNVEMFDFYIQVSKMYLQ